MGIYVSTSNTSALTNKDIREWIFNSDFPIWKIHEEGTFTVTVAALDTWYSTTIAHNLNYKPVFVAYIENKAGTNTRYLIPQYSTELQGVAYSDDTNLTVKIHSSSLGGGNTGTFDGYYYIFKDE